MATMTTEQFRASLRARMPGREGEIMVEAFDAILTDIAAADGRVDTLVADFNTLVAKLNLDAGVTDTDYAETEA